MNKISLTQLIQKVVIGFMGVTLLNVAQADMSGYTFINDKDDRSELVSPQSLGDVAGMTKSEVEEQNLEPEDDNYVVVTFKDLAAWIKSSEDFSPNPDGKNKAQKTGFNQLSKIATAAALRKAVNEINDSEGNPFTAEEIEELLSSASTRLEEVLASSDGLRRINERVDRDGIFTNNQFVVADYYLRINKTAILDEIQPSPIVLSFEDPKIDASQFSNATHYVARFVDEQRAIRKTKAEDESKWAEGFEDAIFSLAREALAEAIVAVNNDLRYPQEAPAIEQLIKEQTAPGQDQYKLLTTNYEIKKKEVWPKGSLRPRNKDDVLMLSVYFYFDREEIKSLVIPPERELAMDIGNALVLAQPPAPNDDRFVGVYEDYTIEVPDDLASKEKARQVALDDALAAFKESALEEAAIDIADRLAQPMNGSEIKKTLQAAQKRENEFIQESGWIGNPVVVTRGIYSTAPETLKLSAYVVVDRQALQRLLIGDRAITIVGKYRTYVELFWNVPGKDINPEVIQTLIASVEDGLRVEGYEVVEFERIKGDLVALLKDTNSEEDLYSSDELERFKANLALRNIDSRFENGKRILADYADLVFGVTINSLEVSGNQVNVRVTVDATLFSQGEWMKLASFDKAMRMPYIEGSQDHLIGVVKKAGLAALAGLSPKVQSQLALRKDREELNLSQDREFTVVFAGSTKDQFGKIRQRLSKGTKWGYKRADSKSKSIYLSYSGNIDSLSDMIQMYLEGADLDPGMGEYSSGVNRIMFGQ